MNGIISRKLMKNNKLTPNAKILLALILSNIDINYKFHCPNETYLAEKINVTKATIKKALKLLEENEYITIYRSVGIIISLTKKGFEDNGI